MKFTDRSIGSLKPQEQRYISWDDNGKGFGVRVSPQGKKTFVYMYRFDGRNRMMSLGEYPDTKLVDANEAHAKAQAQRKKGIDPGAEQGEQKQSDRSAFTMKELAEEYIEKWAKARKRSWKEDQRVLDKDVLPGWKYRKAKNIHRRDVIGLLDEIVNRGAPIQANRTLAVVRKMFNFALSRDIVPFSPCAGISLPSPENQRDRVLNDAEIKQLWNKLDEAKMHNNSKLAIKFILVTGQRAGEVVSAEWSEFDRKARWWAIPGEKAKNGLLHRVPLSPLAEELLKKIKPHSGNSLYLFPSPLSPKKNDSKRKSFAKPEKRLDKPIDESALGHAFRNNLATLGLENVKPHDLRRTAASHMTGAGISRLVVSKILNHVEKGVTAVYDRYGYDTEKRHALDIWAKKLEEVLAGKEEPECGKVVPIKQAK